jgi:hypothetical protein
MKAGDPARLNNQPHDSGKRPPVEPGSELESISKLQPQSTSTLTPTPAAPPRSKPKPKPKLKLKLKPKSGPKSEAASASKTQKHEPLPAPEEDWFSIRDIIDEKRERGRILYLVDWEGTDENGRRYDPTWVYICSDAPRPGLALLCFACFRMQC